MNVTTVVVPQDIAAEKLKEYRTVVKENRRVEDADFRRMYKAAMSGHAIIDISSAFRETGLNELNQPKLAIARGNWKSVNFSRWHKRFFVGRGRAKDDCIHLPDDVWNWSAVTNRDLSTPVPFVPPDLRPKDDLSKYHILFEVQSWTEYPADPFLLKHITGYLYSVIAEWELTELERALLKGHL